MGLTKATIKNCDTGEVFTCLFNPTEYTISKSNDWAKGKEQGRDASAPCRRRVTDLKLEFQTALPPPMCRGIASRVCYDAVLLPFTVEGITVPSVFPDMRAGRFDLNHRDGLGPMASVGA